MLKQKLKLVSNAENIFNFSQSTIDSYLIKSEDREKLISMVKLYLPRMRNHYSGNIMTKLLKNDLQSFDIVVLSKYPLYAAYNTSTRKIVVNMSEWSRKDILNVASADLYALIFYGYVCAYYSVNKLDKNLISSISNFISSMFFQLFSKQYGLSGSYLDLLPKMRYLITIYIMVSFFDIKQKAAYKLATGMAKVNYESLKMDLNKYNFSDIGSFIKVLSDSDILPGFDLYVFTSKMVKRFGVRSICLFEDSMRFMATMAGGSVTGVSIFPPYFEIFNSSVYKDIINYMAKKL